MDFRQRLLATLRRLEPLFEEPGVMVVGSEVPNLLQPGVAATLVVSQDVDIGVPVSRHAALKRRLADLKGLRPSPEEPSVWVPDPDSPELLEVNFLGIDPAARGPDDTYVLEDAELPLLVFGHSAPAGAGSGDAPVNRVDALGSLHARARRARARSAVRAWEYRQRHHAKGVWFRLRRLLAGTASAWSLPEDEARRLVAEGYEAAAVGSQLEPPKILVVVPEERLRAVPGRARVDLRLGPALLGARCLALVPFPPSGQDGAPVSPQGPASGHL